MADYSSNNSDISELTYFKAFENRLAALKTVHEESLSRCFKVSVEGHDTSLHPSDIKALYSRYFRSCGDIYNVVIPSNPARNVVERCGFIYFSDECGQEKALALSGSNVGFQFRQTCPTLPWVLSHPDFRTEFGGWNVVVKALPKESCEFSPDQVTDASRLARVRPYGFSVTGYPTSLRADDVRSALFRLFSSCGKIIYIKIEEDCSQPGLLRRAGFVSLAGKKAYNNAVRLDGSDLGGWNVVVKTLPPPMDTRNHPYKIGSSVGWEGPPGHRWSDINASTSTSSQ